MTQGTVTHRDVGCAKAKKLGYNGPCLECPFEKCLETLDVIRKKIPVSAYPEIRGLREQGKSIKEIAERFNASIKTIYRILGEYDRRINL